jgi:hypothetical protein
VEAAARVTAGEDVLGNAQVGEDGRLLVHRDDAELERRLRVPVHLTRRRSTAAVVRLDDAGDDFTSVDFSRRSR